MYTAVRWLSRGKTLGRVFLLRRELATFLQDQGHKNAYVRDPHVFSRLAHLTDGYEYVNKLNIELRGKGKWVFGLQSAIKAFISKPQMLRKEAETDSYSLFHHYLEFTAAKDIDFHETLDQAKEKHDLLDYLQNLTRDMNARFPE
ncbi:zinc finger BED domain-containing protein 5-like [Macrobrachium nipponense]|uniref:zinc finger BED domain-containing protein 5-like n=1 Tax=Macrobrachium nipponense TaxID=159736 RepID=UPI0030C8C23D